MGNPGLPQQIYAPIQTSSRPKSLQSRVTPIPNISRSRVTPVPKVSQVEWLQPRVALVPTYYCPGNRSETARQMRDIRSD
ncbi:hypothetical protein N7488_009920 [Penicillium malachiteum]|nr:hypothetical protein N7488_009920 [Penicillium malachiteum]